ncbi:Hypp3028 [Branchiostoma lanceolatum]|uniref:Hypp3028 protein n=1 Tax=Branchiostoma lanceolatum TaxID=7740 RepID=A0A8J9ZVW0_BRALA|nr:Hypp3028 [Branchiostoma lanceolatum]
MVENEYQVVPPFLPPRNVADDQNGSAAAHGADSPQGVVDEEDYEVIPPSLPPRNVSGLLADNQNGSAAAHGADSPQGVMDEEEYEVIPPSLPPNNVAGDHNVSAAVHGADSPQGVMDEEEYESVKDDPQSHKYKNSHVTAAVKDTEETVEIIMDPGDYLSFVVTEKDKSQPNKFENSQMTAAAKGPQVILDENDDESVAGKDDPKSHKYANRQVIAAAEYAGTVVQAIRDENDEDSADNQPQEDNQNDPAAVHGADTSDHYQQLRNETLEQQGTYTSVLPQMTTAAKDAAAGPQVIKYENDDDSTDNKTQEDNQNDPAAVHGFTAPGTNDTDVTSATVFFRPDVQLKGTDNSMGEKLTEMLLSLLIILKVFGSTEAACSITGSTADCFNQGLTSVPQNLPTGITRLDLGVMDEEEYESVKDDPQSHKYENSHATAAVKDTETAVQVVKDSDDYLSFVTNNEKYNPQSHKYEISQMKAAAKDAAAAPQVIRHKNDNESGDNQIRADNPNHYQQLRKETLEQQHTYTSPLPHNP